LQASLARRKSRTLEKISRNNFQDGRYFTRLSAAENAGGQDFHKFRALLLCPLQKQI
jgi:hypothetical protein